MFKTLLICTAAVLAACSTTQPSTAPDSRTANVTCVDAASGSRLPSQHGKCGSSAVRSYSQDDVQRTGQTDVGDALRMLDPAVSVHH
jgi:hypothetical protein